MKKNQAQLNTDSSWCNPADPNNATEMSGPVSL